MQRSRAKQKELQEIAKELYLKTENGERVYSLRDIERILREKGFRVSKATIARWAHKNKWDEELKENMLKGYAKALQELKHDLAQDEERKRYLLERLEKLHEDNFRALYHIKIQILKKMLEGEYAPKDVQLLRLILEFEQEIANKLQVETEGRIVVRWGDEI